MNIKPFISIRSFDKALKRFTDKCVPEQYHKFYTNCELWKYGYCDHIPNFKIDLIVKKLSHTFHHNPFKIKSSSKESFIMICSSFISKSIEISAESTMNLEIGFTFEKKTDKGYKRSGDPDVIVFRAFFYPSTLGKKRVARWYIKLK